MLQFMGSQRVGHDVATEQQQWITALVARLVLPWTFLSLLGQPLLCKVTQSAILHACFHDGLKDPREQK